MTDAHLPRMPVTAKICHGRGRGSEGGLSRLGCLDRHAPAVESFHPEHSLLIECNSPYWAVQQFGRQGISKKLAPDEQMEVGRVPSPKSSALPYGRDVVELRLCRRDFGEAPLRSVPLGDAVGCKNPGVACLIAGYPVHQITGHSVVDTIRAERSIVIPGQAAGLVNQPQIGVLALIHRSEPIGGDTRSIALAEGGKSNPIKADQPVKRCNPEISIRTLREAANQILGKPLVDSPDIDPVLRLCLCGV